MGGSAPQAHEAALKDPLLQIANDGQVAKMALDNDFGIVRAFHQEAERARLEAGGG
ncbi:hypothetical protein H7H51_28530 [Mycolicibacterium farcinogenes]|nr:hypothetical protein [Mycolicibacterium farcinogenes]